jgi:hypothetical protein
VEDDPAGTNPIAELAKTEKTPALSDEEEEGMMMVENMF